MYINIFGSIRISQNNLVHYVSPPAGAWKYYFLLHTHGLTPVAIKKFRPPRGLLNLIAFSYYLALLKPAQRAIHS